MGKFLYPIYKLKLPSYKRWWLYHKASGGSGVLSDLIEGDYLILNNSLPKRFNLLQLVGNIIQDGEPSPENEVPILNVSGKVNTKIQNKNLFDGELELGSINPANGELATNTTRTRSKNFIKVKPNTTYTLTRKVGQNRWVIGYTSNKIGISDGNVGNYASALLYLNSSTMSGTFTTSSSTEYIKWYDTMSTDLTEQVQLEVGSTATDYVEHKEQNLPLDLRSKNFWKFEPSYSSTGYAAILNQVNYKLLKGTYRLSFGDMEVGSSVLFRFFNEDKSKYYDARVTNVNKSPTFTVDEDIFYVSLIFNEADSLSNIQLEQGTEATDYEPYYNYELSKINDAEDYFIKEDGKWYLHKEVGKEVFDDTDVFNVNIQEHVFYKEIEKMIVSRKPVITNLFKYRSTTTWGDLENYEICTQGTNKYIFIRNYDCNNLNDFYNLLALKNLIVYYVLATPTNIEITETTLINELEAFSKAKAYEGQTIIYGESDGAEPNYKVKYYMKGE